MHTLGPLVRPPLGTVYFLGRYATGHASPSPLANVLSTFKYDGHRYNGRLLCKLFATALGSLHRNFDVIVAIPLHPRRLRARGYNQAAWLAQAASRTLACPYSRFGLARIDDTPPQALISSTRRGALEGTFTARAAISRFQRVLLIDDVYTSGATACAAARALRDVGVERIDLCVLLMAGRVM